MDDDPGMRPPFAPAPGPSIGDREVLACFARDEPAGHSERFYAEGPVLMAEGDLPVAIRVAPGTVLLRLDVPESLVADRDQARSGLAAAGLELLDEDTLWGLPVALQLAGLRLGSFDLWGTDIEEAFAAVRRVAVGDQGLDSPEPGPWG